MPTTHANAVTEGAIWERLLVDGQATMTPETARAFLALEYSPADKERMSALAAKARQGHLTTGEEAEIDCYGRVASALGILKSKGRRALNGAVGKNGKAT